MRMQEVSVYTRPHGGSRTPQKANPNEIYPVGTTYQLRYGSKWLTLKKGCPILNLEEDCPSVAEAQICAIRLRTLLFTGATAAPQAQPRQKPKPEVQTVDKQIDNYLYGTEGKAAQKDWRKHTLQCYARSLKLFRESCKKVRDEEIDGDDLRKLKVFLRQQKTSTGKKISARSVYNHFNNVISFLNAIGRRELIPQDEWPKYEEPKVVPYDPETMARLLQFADVEERDVLESFLGNGFRNGEWTHTEWPDIDLRNKEIHVYSKQERFGWQVKDSEQRIIGISDSLAQRLDARHKRHPGNGLVFPNTKGKPDKHLLRVIKRVALRAGLNCGQCMGTHERKRVSCATHPVCHKWIIHTMRKTWATIQNLIGVDRTTIQEHLGHSSADTTKRYLASIDRRSPRRREQINAAAALVRLPDGGKAESAAAQ